MKKKHRTPPRGKGGQFLSKRAIAARRNLHKARKSTKKGSARSRAKRRVSAACSTYGDGLRSCATSARSRGYCTWQGRGLRRCRPNPPKRAPRRAAGGSPKLAVYRLGTVESVVYRRSDGRRYVHHCGRGSALLAPKSGQRFVVINGVGAAPFLEG